jgi:concentrative nucleoside transporter, CNT family
MPIVQALAGLVVFHAVLWLLSENRAGVKWSIAAAGLGLQFALALIFVRWPPAAHAFDLVNALMTALQTATEAGTSFVFGFLGGGPAPYAVVEPAAAYVLAVRALPLIIVVSALARVLTYWRILPALVRLGSLALERVLGIGGALGLSAAANLFVGMTEAPLVVRPYLARMSRSELFALMSTGMATIAGTVFVLYAAILADVVPNVAGHLLAASLMSLPAAIAFSFILIPPTACTGGEIDAETEDAGSFDALTRGTFQGLELYLNIVAMLLVLVALVHLLNMGLGLIEWNDVPLSLERILGWALAPVCWFMGIPWAEAPAAGALMGTKVVLNELIAYIDLTRLPADALSAQSKLVLTYALCGFANFGSLGMLVGGLGLLVPERRPEILELGLRSIVVGTLATCTTGAVVGLVA